ncbi:E3 ubiquitin-protein ligase RSL1 [Linum grandiflorum]
MLVYDDGNDGDDEVVITQSECPHCHRLFCARCRVPWHPEIDCDEFRRRIKDEREKEGDMMLVNLAGRKMWKRCPSCKFFVERTSGCRYIKCRCGIDFCYGCGGTCIGVATHVCTKCG